MRPIITDRVACTVCPSVGISFTLVSPAKTAGPIEMPFGLWTRVGPKKHVLDGAQIPHAKGQLLAERTCPAMPNDILPWAVQKWLNRSICRLGYGLGWTEGSTSSIIVARLRQCALTGGHVGVTWRIRLKLNLPSAAAMWSYVKLLWPLIITIRPHRSIST